MSSEIRDIELLAPARTADIGIEAINCGADAVYIGADKFGARHAAGNTLPDIKRLADYAHRYGAKVYVTLNTILYDDELDEARTLALELHRIGVDALIVQDTAFLQMNLPIPLHASTQMDIRSADKVRQLHSWGFGHVVLARELGLKDIAAIHRQCPDVLLEAFVHGALCVSYSGRCYASQHCFGRSANRGECAQFCRLAFDLEDDQGNVLVQSKHLLSLKDMNRSRHVEQMLDAGISSLKIEGRLKDVDYVKNVTAFYSNLLDNIIRKRPQHYRRAAQGRCHINFTPDLGKTFNRGFTDYFLNGRTPQDIASIHTPKAVGQYVGQVKEVRASHLLVSSTATFHNGDGLSYFDPDGTLQGFRVNRADTNKLYPHQMPRTLAPKTPLYRNHDAAFHAAMLRPTPIRTLPVSIAIEDTEGGFRLSATDQLGRTARITKHADHQEARTPQADRIAAELSKTGGTGLEVVEVVNHLSANYFIPASQLSQWRRELIEEIEKKTHPDPPLQGGSRLHLQSEGHFAPSLQGRVGEGLLDFTENISNREAAQFYRDHGAAVLEPAFEVQPPQGSVPLMTCRHCIKHTLGMCRKDTLRSQTNTRQLYLRLPDGQRFPLQFNCQKCEMQVMS